MHRMRNLLSLTIAILALSAPAAHADLPTPAAMAAAQQHAIAHWATSPCAGQVTITWAHAGTAFNAHSDWWVPAPAAAAPTWTSCSITFNLDVPWDWPKLCTIVEHEYGHLSGHEHTVDGLDVMSPTYHGPAAGCDVAAAPVKGAGPALQITSRSRHAAHARRAAAQRAARRRSR